MNILLIFPGFILVFIVVLCYEYTIKNLYETKTLEKLTETKFDKVLVRDSDGMALVVEQNETRWKCALYSLQKIFDYIRKKRSENH